MSTQTYEDRDGWIWLDGVFVPHREAKLHMLSHALHYASSVFEGERAYDGVVYKLNEHSQRLIDSAAMLDFTIPYTLEEINRATQETVARSGMKDCYIRPVAWRGSEMMGVSAQSSKIHLGIAVWEWPSYFSPEAKMKGIRLQISEWRRPAPNTIPTKAKAAGLYMICTLSKHRAEREGFQDAIMLDWRGLVAEATGANVFFVKDGKVHTPTPDCFLDGITRRAVMALARAKGIEVVERAIQPEELTGFSECFLTGTAAEVTPVSEIGPYRFTPGPICKTLIDAFETAKRPAKAAAE